MEKLETGLNERIDGLETGMEKLETGLNERMDNLETRMDEMKSDNDMEFRAIRMEMDVANKSLKKDISILNEKIDWLMFTKDVDGYEKMKIQVEVLAQGYQELKEKIS